MQIPLQITFHGIDHSDAVEERIREKTAKLEQIFDRITSCRVVIEHHHRNSSSLHHKGEVRGTFVSPKVADDVGVHRHALHV